MLLSPEAGRTEGRVSSILPLAGVLAGGGRHVVPAGATARLSTRQHRHASSAGAARTPVEVLALNVKLKKEQSEAAQNLAVVKRGAAQLGRFPRDLTAEELRDLFIATTTAGDRQGGLVPCSCGLASRGRRDAAAVVRKSTCPLRRRRPWRRRAVLRHCGAGPRLTRAGRPRARSHWRNSGRASVWKCWGI